MLKRLIPLALFALCLGLVFLARWAWHMDEFLRQPVTYLGAAAALLGATLAVLGLYQLRKSRTTVAAFREPEHLVTGGVFGFTRNPIYLGMALELAGGCILLGARCLLVPVLVFLIVVDRWVIRREEKKIARKFGKEYEDYRSRTPRWV
jgi:protein-S-isoprenylcysteine O-methyltransferase Ste14